MKLLGGLFKEGCMKLLTTYEADAGACVINGIGIDNGFGDGEFGVYYSNKLPKGFEVVKNLWIGLSGEVIMNQSFSGV